MRKYAFVLSGLLSVLLFSCSGEAPRILQNNWMLQYVQDTQTGTVGEELSLFLLCEDGDGIEDVSTLYVIHDDSEGYWEVPKEQWSTKNSGKSRWVGFNRFVPDNSVFLDGSYRIQLLDQAGLEAETRIYLPPNRLSLDSIEFPKVTVEKQQITIEGNYPKYLLWFYDSEGNLVHSHYTRKGSYSLSELMNNRSNINAETMWVFVFLESRYSGIKTGPYFLN